MRNYSLFFLLLFISYSLVAQSTFQQDSIRLKKIVDRIKTEYASDKRIKIFNIEISTTPSLVLKGETNDPKAYADLIEAVKDINVTDNIILLPSKELGDKIYGVINLSVADIRVKNKFSAEMATQALLGTPIKIYQKDDWYRIQTPDGYIGWTQLSTFTPMNKEEFNTWTKAPKVIFKDYFGFSYQQPDKNSQPVSDLVSGNILKLEGETTDFYKVAYPDGRLAYVEKSLCSPLNDWLQSRNLTGESLVQQSFHLMGIPYVWGGTSVKGMDCSGFTKTVLFQHGVILLRDASQQAYTGIPVDISQGYSNLKKGDLMFFGKKAENDKKERIRHVGFYIGNNEFIHASGCIRIGSLDPSKDNYDELNTKEFVRASRVEGAVGTNGIWAIPENPFYQVQD